MSNNKKNRTAHNQKASVYTQYNYFSTGGISDKVNTWNLEHEESYTELSHV